VRMRRKPNLDKRMERCADLLISDPAQFRGNWLGEFSYNELHLELGCGKGRFTAETAKQSQNTLLIGLEKVENIIVIALERAKQEDVSNVRFIQGLADDLIEFFAPGEVARIYLNFSDPWPSRRHAKRRLTAQSFLSLYRQVLCSGGEIHFKTDNLPLFEFSLREFQTAGFEIMFETRDLHKDGPIGAMTDYEEKFYEQGALINKCIVSKKDWN